METVEGNVQHFSPEWEVNESIMIRHSTVHVYPKDEGHLLHEECPCEPTVIFKENLCLMIHDRGIEQTKTINEVSEILRTSGPGC